MAGALTNLPQHCPLCPPLCDGRPSKVFLDRKCLGTHLRTVTRHGIESRHIVRKLMKLAQDSSKGVSRILELLGVWEMPLGSRFFSRPPAEVAKDLIGKIIVRRIGPQYIMARILATEAYGDKEDAFSYFTRRVNNGWKMQAYAAGTAYITSVHGCDCFNLIAKEQEKAGAVLISAVQALTVTEGKNIFGPGRVSSFLRITRDMDGIDITKAKNNVIFFQGQRINYTVNIISTSKRIGSPADDQLLWRFGEA